MRPRTPRLNFWFSTVGQRIFVGALGGALLIAGLILVFNLNRARYGAEGRAWQAIIVGGALLSIAIYLQYRSRRR